MKFFLLYVMTAIAEIVGCYSAFAWLRLRTAFWTVLFALAFTQNSFSEPPPGPDFVSQGLAAIQAGDFQGADDDFRNAVQSFGPSVYHAIGTAEAANRVTFTYTGDPIRMAPLAR